MKKIFHSKVSVLLVAMMVVAAAIGLVSTTSSAATAPKKITLNKKSATVTAGKTVTLKVKAVSPTKASKAVTWKSSNTKYATVSSKGVVTAKKAGAGKTVTITATSKYNKKIKATAKVKIVYAKTTSVKLNRTTLTGTTAKKPVTVKATVKGTYAAPVTWSTSNKKVATVKSTGTNKAQITLKGIGSATITAKSGTKKATIKVTVYKKAVKNYASGGSKLSFTIPNTATKLIFKDGDKLEDGSAKNYDTTLQKLVPDVNKVYTTIKNGGKKTTVYFFGYSAVIAPTSETKGTITVKSTSTVDGLNRGQYTYTYTRTGSNVSLTAKETGINCRLVLKTKYNIALYFGNSTAASQMIASFYQDPDNTKIYVGKASPQYTVLANCSLYYSK